MVRFRSQAAASAFAASLLLVVGIAAAQGPSPGQVTEIRHECRSDYIRHCSDVPPGGQPALACLQRNAAQLSGDCRRAVEAIGAPSGAGPANTPRPAR